MDVSRWTCSFSLVITKLNLKLLGLLAYHHWGLGHRKVFVGLSHLMVRSLSTLSMGRSFLPFHITALDGTKDGAYCLPYPYAEGTHYLCLFSIP